MKTPMQELIETFEEMRSPIDSKVDVDFAISLVKSMLEKEKEVMYDAWLIAISNFRNDTFFEEYYNETPMQEHIEWLEEKYRDLLRQEFRGAALEIGDCIDHAESLLNKEKEVVMEAHYAPKYGCFSENYYFDRFNTKEK